MIKQGLFVCTVPSWSLFYEDLEFNFVPVYSGVHVTLESLLKDKELKATIKDLVCGSGRSHPQVDEATTTITSDRQQIANVLQKNPTEKPLNGVPQKETVAVS